MRIAYKANKENKIMNSVDITSSIAADPDNPYYIAISNHISEVFEPRGIDPATVTWLDVVLIMTEVKNSPSKTVVQFPSSSVLDKVRHNILSEFSFAKVYLTDSAVVCIDPADAAFIMTKYL